MPRDGTKTAEAIRETAIRLFFEHGYEATTLRDIAGDVVIKVGSLYNHISSKEELLFSIMHGIMRDLLAATEQTLAAYPDPAERLRAAIELHVSFHVERSHEVFIGNSELRSLPPTKRAAVVEMRDAYERLIREIVDSGVSSGVFHTADPRLITYAIVAIGTHVADWYRPGGRLEITTIASVYSDFVLRSLCNPEQQVAPGEVLGGRLPAPV
jgi:AcrR family transcriptional regulator